MRKAGATTEPLASKAYEFRRSERMTARQKMRANGDFKSVEKLEARDAAKYGKRGLGDKHGPDFEGLNRDAADTLLEKPGREPSNDEFFESIVESATRTDFITNAKFFTF